MRIYGEIDERLAKVLTFDHFLSEYNYLLVVHPNDTEAWIEQELKERLTDNYCKGVLIVKGVPRAGLSTEKFEKLRMQYGDRFHISACAVGGAEESTALSGSLQTRFKTFFEHARHSDSKLEWSILDPQWPENLLAAYLLAVVMSTDSPEASLIEGRPGEWRSIWEAAKQEYELLTGSSLAQSRLNRTTAADVVTDIGNYLQTIEAGVS